MKMSTTPWEIKRENLRPPTYEYIESWKTEKLKEIYKNVRN